MGLKELRKPLQGLAKHYCHLQALRMILYRCFAQNEREKLADLPANKRHANAQDAFISKFLLVHGCCERFQIELFKKGILAGKRVIDIGAHVGWV